MFADQHMHTCFSTDSEAEPREMAERACELGLRRICVTDHHDIGFPVAGEYFTDLEAYLPAMRALREDFRGRLEVGIGIELGLLPDTGAETAAVAAKYPFDFVIGSLHVLGGRDPYYREEYPEYTDEAFYHSYFEDLLASLRAARGIHSLGHIDYIVRYGHERERAFSLAAHAEVIDEILRILVERGIALEVNTRALHALPFAHPHPGILRRYRELGGELVTVGSDAHRPAEIAFGFDRVAAELRDCGFRYTAEFVCGAARMEPLD